MKPLKTIITFCLGAIAMLIFLTPGAISKDRVKALQDEEVRAKTVDFNEAGRQIESVRDRVNEYVGSKFCKE